MTYTYRFNILGSEKSDWIAAHALATMISVSHLLKINDTACHLSRSGDDFAITVDSKESFDLLAAWIASAHFQNELTGLHNIILQKSKKPVDLFMMRNFPSDPLGVFCLADDARFN